MTSREKAAKRDEPGRERLTRDKIVRAALRIMDEEGLEAVTMRRVAKEVGVEAMSLYNHVKDKDDILDGVCSCVMQDFQLPDDGSDAYGAGRAVAHEWRRILKAHPNVMALLAERQRPLSETEALMPMEVALRVLRQMGLTERDTVKAFHVMGGYIMGFVMMEVGQMFSAANSRADGASAEQLTQRFPKERFPALAAAIPLMADCDPDEQFEFGLDLLLAGLASRLSAH